MNGLKTDKRGYFKKIFEEMNFKSKLPKLIIISHVLNTTENFINELNDIFGISLLIPKPNSVDSAVLNRINENIPTRLISKEEIKNETETVFRYLSSILGTDDFVIMDIGGYFSGCMLRLEEMFGSKFKGIIEDTENGFQKYKKELEYIGNSGLSVSFPVISVARSPLKDSEDYLVGREIALKSQIFLSKYGEMIYGKRALVLGFGKIGRSLALNLREMGVYVTVIDTNPIRQAFSISNGFISSCLSSLNDNDLIFCATGNKCLDFKTISQVYGKKYFFSVTSPDDEFKDYNEILQFSDYSDDKKNLIISNIDSISIIVHHGNAINFQETKSILSKFIKLVQSEILYSALTINEYQKNEISEVSEHKRKFLAEIWNNYDFS